MPIKDIFKSLFFMGPARGHTMGPAALIVPMSYCQVAAGTGVFNTAGVGEKWLDVTVHAPH